MTSTAGLLTTVSATVTPFRVLYISLVMIVLNGIYQVLRTRHESKSPRRLVRRGGGAHRRPSIIFDRTMLRRIVELLRICFPSMLSLESGMVLLLSILMALRSMLSLRLARLMGESSEALVRKQLKRFVFSVVDVAVYAIPTTVTAVGIAYTTSTMERRFRERLQDVLHGEYFRGHRVYDLAMTRALDNPAHRVTNDVQRFCSELTGLLPAVVKPLVDIVIFSTALARFGGYGAPLSMMSYYALVGVIFSSVMPNFASLVARSREKEGNLRMMHTQLIQHAEEVAFYRGADVECENADRFLRSFVRLERHIKRVKWWTSFVNSFFVKYGATCVGYAICAFVVHREKDHLDAAALTQLHVHSTQLYIPLSMAVGKLLSLQLKIGGLCGSAHRVGELRDALRILERDRQSTTGNVTEVVDSNQIVFKDAAIVTPADQVAIQSYTEAFQTGQPVLIMGCNGSGKTALFRTLCGLWPLRNGRLERPPLPQLLFLTQRVYLPPGTLRTQLIYPAVEEEERARGLSDATLLQFASDMGLGGVVEREGGLDAEKDWNESLSGGERQRVGLVRAMYHRPMFAFLDECTSAISQDVEPALYEVLQRCGLTLITVSHREALKALHQKVVILDGVGGYSVRAVEKRQ
ncbi:ABC transporter [Trypanosoma grayi]|uniref:ABC transporter n=1 Tax=Trypanosoma grayi TaxID=71804 RepID=UPI0004F4907F|nr:ABC transporter [Trypanosoma grayi]KEG11633.1 ABC transporter [Trypanosoma grayi]